MIDALPFILYIIFDIIPFTYYFNSHCLCQAIHDFKARRQWMCLPPPSHGKYGKARTNRIGLSEYISLSLLPSEFVYTHSHIHIHTHTTLPGLARSYFERMYEPERLTSFDLMLSFDSYSAPVDAGALTVNGKCSAFTEFNVCASLCLYVGM